MTVTVAATDVDVYVVDMSVVVLVIAANKSQNRAKTEPTVQLGHRNAATNLYSFIRGSSVCLQLLVNFHMCIPSFALIKLKNILAACSSNTWPIGLFSCLNICIKLIRVRDLNCQILYQAWFFYLCNIDNILYYFIQYSAMHMHSKQIHNQLLIIDPPDGC